MKPQNVLIMGAAGRDFHNFNVFFRGNDAYEVVAFTATQIPDIAGRSYPAALAGQGYPKGIPIYAEKDMLESSSRSTRSTRWSSPTPTSPTRTSCTRPPSSWPRAPTSC